MTTPAPIIISSYDGGKHNENLGVTIERLDRESAWKDLSTIVITPSRDTISTRVVASWERVIFPPNNSVHRVYTIDTEVGAAYSLTIEGVLKHPELSKWKYVLTREHDNMPPADGLIRLLEQMEAHPEFAAIGGLYFTKGEGGCAQIWGSPKDPHLNFRPQRPDPNGGLVECCGTGMGWTLFRLSMFKDERLRRPWFRTVANKDEGVGTQDLHFWGDARQNGYRCAIDCSVRVGHYDKSTDTVW